MSVAGKYLHKNVEFLDRSGDSSEYAGWSFNGHKNTDKVYTFEEALDLAGRGWYTYGLVAFLILALHGITLDMFGISVVLTGACDMNLTHNQKTILLSTPFAGSIVTAWPWGFAADTQGRRRALAFSLWGSFILSTLSTFSPNWIVLAVLKFGSCGFSSGTQSLGFTLLGESCSQKLRASLIIIVSTSLIITFGSYIVIGYLILNLDVSFDLEFITFSNWRLLNLVFTLPLGLSATLLGFIYESPKYLVNAGNVKKALDTLKNITRRNGGDVSKYPVRRIVLEETKTLRMENVPLWKSLKDQTVPLFQPPLLYKTIQLFYITAVIYSTNNGFFIWLPFVMDTFYSGYNENATAAAGVCDMIVNSNKLDAGMETCVGTVSELVLWMAVAQSSVYTIINIGVFSLSRWKKSVFISLMLFCFACGVVIPAVTDRIASMILLEGFMISCVCISIIFSYYVDMFPTSYRGMAACLGVMVARGSALVGSNLVGSYLDSHCTTSFYAWSFYVLSGVVVSWFLPPDNVKRESQ
ncbi:jg779 [Pararge aegeria aegeria]|uniref:Jg779 protein n=1 Tax=Pararge aegeria aegeria TaxID=348720 RepID=A0A8S4S2V8_9NEOP|nr:jg779 [Pararge aegeria aegeria]